MSDEDYMTLHMRDSTCFQTHEVLAMSATCVSVSARLGANGSEWKLDVRTADE
jgi:hypothetical protein